MPEPRKWNSKSIHKALFTTVINKTLDLTTTQFRKNQAILCNWHVRGPSLVPKYGIVFQDDWHKVNGGGGGEGIDGKALGGRLGPSSEDSPLFPSLLFYLPSIFRPHIDPSKLETLMCAGILMKYFGIIKNSIRINWLASLLSFQFQILSSNWFFRHKGDSLAWDTRRKGTPIFLFDK